MGYPSITEIQEETKSWDFIDQLPEQVGQFTRKRVGTIDGQVLTICRYEAPALRASLDITYSSETFDYILVHTMGMNSYRDIRFIYKEKGYLRPEGAELPARILDAMEHPRKVNLGEMVEEKRHPHLGLRQQPAGKKIGPFQLYIKPANAIEHINGSIIVIDYSNFVRKDQLIIMYNRLRDEFFGK